MNQYDKNFKEEAVKLVLDLDRPVRKVAQELGIHENTLYKWIRQYKEHKGDAFPGSGNQRTEDEEIKRLKKIIDDLQEENAILKKATGHLRKAPEIIYEFIYQHRFKFRVQKMCRVLEVSRSGYYAWLKRPESDRKRRDKYLLKKIREIHKDSRGTYGSPRITRVLQKQGVRCSPKRVARLMRENGIVAKTKRRFKATTNSKHNYPVAGNLLNQDFNVDRPNNVWVADITYIPTNEGWLYLATIQDLFNRKIVGWAMDKTMTRKLVLGALRQAHRRYRPQAGLIHHSDRGSQYASYEYQQALKDYHMVPSMSRKGNCYDNACMESFFGTLKQELIYGIRFRTRAEARQAIFEYIEVFYNRSRLHSALGYMSPVEYEQLFSQTAA
ncbi:IS3 family transposase [Metallumcola ferriviriculae]|uniref:IS3 family transposase n=1 Tax=Metallumcola ferriviriculae TaxID=3039180 RepID=A0AAU0URI3_9FIRM|nr:IS3 family transposase [Desulfitibacteraceae bacterium MK1]WRO21808.1 IS3 family transposase [Desulfitibacteraceae bacterium MK1]